MFSILTSVFGDDDSDGTTTTTDSPSAASASATTTTTATDGDDVRIVDRLIEELEAGELTPAERATLKDAFGGSASRSEMVSIEHLKAEVMDLRAYTDALEEMIDEDGTADDRFDACHDRIDRLEDELDGLRTELDTTDVDADIDRIDARIEDLETTIGSLHRELEMVKTMVDDLRGWQAAVIAAVRDETPTAETGTDTDTGIDTDIDTETDTDTDTADIDPTSTTSEMVFELE